MATIIDSGKARNLHNIVQGAQLVVDSAEKRFVTYINDLGGVHTIIVDVEHAAQDADALLKWFETTRGLVATNPGDPTAPGHLTTAQVREKSAELTGIIKPAEPTGDATAPAEPTTEITQQTGGGY